MPNNGFTERAQDALRTAQEIVQRKRHAELDVAHILLALLQPLDSLAGRIITRMGADPRVLAARVDAELDGLPRVRIRPPGLAQIHISPAAQRAVSSAAEEAATLNDEYIGTEHLLLAITAMPDGITERLLQEMHINPAHARTALAEFRPAGQEAGGDQDAPAPTDESLNKRRTKGFTDEAQTALRTAQEIVQQKRHSQLDVEHILLALLKPRDGLISKIVEKLNGDPRALARRLDDQLNASPRLYSSYTGLAQLHISIRAQRVFSGAAEEAIRLGDDYIGVEHLFLTIAAERGGAAALLLDEVGIDRTRVAAALEEMGPRERDRGHRPASRPARGIAAWLRAGMPVAPEADDAPGTGAGTLRIEGPAPALAGQLPVPGDKSISHRAALFGAVAHGTTRIRGFLPANDCLATLGVVQALGVPVTYGAGEVVVQGDGPGGLHEPERPLFCGGSGTTIRLLAGLLAGQPFTSILDGNAQLRRRPMGRVATPLRAMGATILGRQDATLAPLTIAGGGLHGVEYATPVASAQVKSAILLAGLSAEGATTVREPSPSRDHTERMLRAMGTAVEVPEPGVVRISPGSLQALAIMVPGDISSAAFLLAAASIVPGAQVRLDRVGVNPTRTGVLDVLRAMGAAIREEAPREEHGEPVADLVVEGRPLRGTRIAGALIPRLIDELPVLAVVATQADGVTEVRDAAELRVKETDRIATVAVELGKLGARIEPLPDGFRVHGPTRLHGAAVSSHGDHRLAMALAVAALVADGETVIAGTACIADSYPGFAEALRALGVQVTDDAG